MPEALPPLMFFNRREAAVVEAVTARIVPSEPGSPGAREAQAVVFIDRALAGYYSALQAFYREGIAMIERIAMARHGASFTEIDDAAQDEVLRVIENPPGPDGSDRGAQFFAVIREQTIEGTFGDPIYGGNAGAVGWQLIGFPGAQWGYTTEQMAPGFDARTIPVATLADIQRRG